jgi:hypothetical protein
MKDSTTLVLTRKAMPDGTLYVQAGGRGYAVKIAPYHFDNLTKSDGGFFGDNILGIDETKTNELRFNDALGKKKETLLKSVEGAGGPAKTVWNARPGRTFTSEKVQDLLTALKGLRLETSSGIVKKGGEVLSFSLVQDKVMHSIRIWNKPVTNDENTCFAFQADNASQAYCLEESSLQNLVNSLARLYEAPAR